MACCLRLDTQLFGFGFLSAVMIQAGPTAFFLAFDTWRENVQTDHMSKSAEVRRHGV